VSEQTRTAPGRGRARAAGPSRGRAAPRAGGRLPAEPLAPKRLRAVVEALAFATEEPLTPEDLADLFPGVPRGVLDEALDGVERACEAPERGLRLLRVAGGRRLATKSELGEWVRALFRSRNRRRLSTQALETLAIVAYRQPITTPEIQAVRGTDPSAVLEGLLEKRLIRILGRKKVVGKPVLYGTTREFLAHFGLDALDELPDLEEFGGFAASDPPPAGPGGGRGAAGGGDRLPFGDGAAAAGPVEPDPGNDDHGGGGEAGGGP
jgi:segregation and condensation protein B